MRNLPVALVFSTCATLACAPDDRARGTQSADAQARTAFSASASTTVTGSTNSLAGTSASAAPSTSALPTESQRPRPPDDALDVRAETFCDQLHAPLVRLLKERCTEADRAAYPAASGVHTRVQKVWPETCREQLTPERVTFDPERARACMRAFEAHLSASFPPGIATLSAWELPPCFDVFEGRQRAGEACRSSVDCQAEFYCTGQEMRADLTRTEGTCAGQVRLGEACEADYPTFGRGRSCASGSYCSKVSQTCRAPEIEGAECWWERDACAAGLTCRGRKCTKTAPPRVGDRCLLNADCGAEALHCARDTTASLDAGTCAARQAAGAACVTDDECQGTCEKNRCERFCGSG